MSEQKFTAGPWHDDYRGGPITGPTTATVGGPCCGGRNWKHIPVQAGQQTVAIIPQQEGHDGLERMAANARLMAAAPDLISFALAHDVYMLDAGYSGPESDALHPKAAANWRECRRVIALAQTGAR